MTEPEARARCIREGRCTLCGVRHPPDRPNLAHEFYVVEPNGRRVFLASRRQCRERREYVGWFDARYAAGLRIVRAARWTPTQAAHP